MTKIKKQTFTKFNLILVKLITINLILLLWLYVLGIFTKEFLDITEILLARIAFLVSFATHFTLLIILIYSLFEDFIINKIYKI